MYSFIVYSTKTIIVFDGLFILLTYNRLVLWIGQFQILYEIIYPLCGDTQLQLAMWWSLHSCGKALRFVVSEDKLHYFAKLVIVTHRMSRKGLELLLSFICRRKFYDTLFMWQKKNIRAAKAKKNYAGMSNFDNVSEFVLVLHKFCHFGWWKYLRWWSVMW